MVKKYSEHPISWYLYQKHDFGNEIITPKLIQDFLTDSDPIEFFCPICKTDSLIRTRLHHQNTISHDQDRNINESILTIAGNCQRGGHSSFYYIFHYRERKLTKIGQLPSSADFDQSYYKKFARVLPEQYLKDLARASGLVSHSIGIGSFIYLRRVFEYIIEDAHQRAKESSDFPEDQYLKSRMSEKIEILKMELPLFITENAQIYSILSKTIHELSEETALKYFPVIKSSIEYILEEMLEKEQLKIKKTELSSLIKEIHQDLK
ncbi:hypothetical protein CH372_17355 [Leptospira meyeri]|uniref:hypothetical protein n=1 Tax=Leptospira meyeri TaxID=29508 RepID=UPI000C2AA111|nr:hypothetical protein [Leptospira meyeri]PKA10850.1 hypothetical protein CH372_17355 [Leptospira meyeri]